MRGWAIFLGGLLLSALLLLWILRDPTPPPAPVPRAASRPAPVRSVPALVAAPSASAAAAPDPEPGGPLIRRGLTAPPSGDPYYPMLKIVRARPVISAHDPKLWTALRMEKNRMSYLSIARPVRDCVRAFMARRGHTKWMFGGVARLQIRVLGGVISFPFVDVTDHGITGMADRPPDQELLSCYQRAVQTFRIKCAECKEGEIEVSWRLRTLEYAPGADLLNSRPEPEVRDPGFTYAGAATR